MTARNLLHLSKLEDFKLWLDAQGIPHRPGRGHYEVLQVQVVKPFWCCIFWREYMPEHYTVEKRLVNTVRRFLQSGFTAQALVRMNEAYLHRKAVGLDSPINKEETEPCPTAPPWET